MATDLSNVKQVLLASQMYAGDNNDHLPHPTWGTVDGSSGAGPDGWAYAVANAGRIPNAPAYVSDCAGFDVNSVQFTNQAQFFKIGQLGPFIADYYTLWCRRMSPPAMGRPCSSPRGWGVT